MTALSLLMRSARHAANRTAPVTRRPRDGRSDSRQGHALGTRSQSGTHPAGAGSANSRGARHGRAGRGAHDDLAHPHGVPGWRARSGAARRAAPWQTPPIRHRSRGPGGGTGMLASSAGQCALDGATVARCGAGRAWTATHQPRNRSSAAKKTASSRGAN